MTGLQTLGGNNGSASSINNRGQIVGGAENTRLDSTCPIPQKFQFQAGSLGERPGPGTSYSGSDQSGFVFTINDNGEAVGTSGDCAGLQPNGTLLVSRHALLWQTGRVTDLGTLGGKELNFAYGINNNGQVVGTSDLAGDEYVPRFSLDKAYGDAGPRHDSRRRRQRWPRH